MSESKPSEEPRPEAGTPAPEAAPATAALPAPESARAGLDFVLDVPLHVTVEIGSSRMLVKEVLQLDTGAVIELDRMTGEPVDVLVNGRRVARGEVTMVGERLAVRLLQIEGRALIESQGS